MTHVPFNDETIDTHEKFKNDMRKMSDEYFEIKNLSHDKIMYYMKYDLPILAIMNQVLFSTAIMQMKSINLMFSALERLPNNEEFNTVKKELEKQKKDTLETLLPIKKLSEQLEASKNKKVDYIG
ncbi:MAG: hypothetical protein ACE5GR_05620 [Nitrosopumilus sp.]